MHKAENLRKLLNKRCRSASSVSSRLKISIGVQSLMAANKEEGWIEIVNSNSISGDCTFWTWLLENVKILVTLRFFLAALGLHEPRSLHSKLVCDFARTKVNYMFMKLKCFYFCRLMTLPQMCDCSGRSALPWPRHSQPSLRRTRCSEKNNKSFLIFMILCIQ